MGNRVAITGIGIISAIGNGIDENLQSLKSSRHGISRTDNIETTLRDKILVGEVKLCNEELADKLHVNSRNSFSRSSLLGAIAVKEALQNAGLSADEISKTGFINSTTVGGMDMTERYFNRFETEPDTRKYIETHDTGSNTHNIAELIGFKGLITTISTACSSAANAIMLGARLIKTGRIERVIVGGMDALSRFTMNGFHTLMILSDDYNSPFDENRKGLNLGEGAAYLVLESEKSLQNRGVKPIAFLSGYANANDAYHQTASSEEGIGAYLAMEKALEISGLDLGDIDYINAHGTATGNNDLSEGMALQRFFGEKMPDFSSTKPFTGHTLAAAAAVEAVFSIFCLREQMIFPNLNFETGMKELFIRPVIAKKHKKVANVLSNSFGFGGNCSTLIFSKE